MLLHLQVLAVVRLDALPHEGVLTHLGSLLRHGRGQVSHSERHLALLHRRHHAQGHGSNERS